VTWATPLARRNPLVADAVLGQASFHQLIADCSEPLEVVARFLAVLELYREACVHLNQDEAFGELLVSWAADRVAP